MWILQCHQSYPICCHSRFCRAGGPLPRNGRDADGSFDGLSAAEAMRVEWPKMAGIGPRTDKSTVGYRRRRPTDLRPIRVPDTVTEKTPAQPGKGFIRRQHAGGETRMRSVISSTGYSALMCAARITDAYERMSSEMVLAKLAAPSPTGSIPCSRNLAMIAGSRTTAPTAS